MDSLGHTRRRGPTRLAWLLAALASLMVACAHSGAATSGADVTQAQAKSTPEVRETVHIRIWADRHYRDEHDSWSAHVEQQVRLVNDTLSEELDVRVTVTDLREWTPNAGPDDLDTLLDELRETDRGDDVDLVIAMTAALPFENRSQRRLGYSALLGKHFVVRGVDPTSDLAELRAQMPEATDEELQREARMRAEHRERTTILHELGHVLGAVHTRSERWVMSPVYERRQHEFSPENRQILRRSVELLLETDNHDAWQRRVSADVQAWVHAGESGAFIPQDAAQVHQHMLALLAPESLTANEARIFNESQAAAREGNFEQALEIIEPLLESRPEHPMVMGAMCQFRVPIGKRDDETMRYCARAMQARPEDPLPALFLAQMQVERAQMRRAMSTLYQAEARLAASDDQDPRDWMVLAVLYQRTGALTGAENAATKAEGRDGAANIKAWARKLRRTWGLARGSIPARTEFLVAGKLRDFDGHLNKDHFDEAGAIAAQLESEFSGTAIVDVAYCRLLTARGDIQQAVPHCRDAIARDASASMAHYVIGVWETTQRNYRAANTHLSKAISLTPSVQGFWHSLGRLYREADARDAYRQLAQDYYERFGETIPVP